MPKSIVVYSRLSCAPCQMLKKYLAYKKLQFTEIDVDNDQIAYNTVAEQSGYSMVPLIVITKQDDSQQIVAGYNLRQLTTALV